MCLQITQSVRQRLIDEQQKKERELLERLLPAVKSQTSGIAEDVERLQQLTLANTKLDKEVSHYKQVLSQTEDILQNLQRSVEEEEKRWHEKEEGHHKERLLWQQQLAQAQAEASQRKNAGPTEREKQLEERCAALEADLRQLHGLQETTSEVCGVQFAFSCIERTLPSIVNEVVWFKRVRAWFVGHQQQQWPAAYLDATLLYASVTLQESRNAQDVRTHLESRVRELEGTKLMRDDYDRLKQELAEVKAQLAEARRAAAKADEESSTNHSSLAQTQLSTSSPTKAVPDAVSPATNGPSASPTPAEKEKDDKLECSELGTIARPSGDAPCSKNTNSSRTKKRVRMRKGSSNKK
ncbi:hypothetical protein HPB52_020241 [Rhipicephalus sanguineus]|uniref:Uncharacterized protein n=1 Tax=Rhipicephalus sanguineus TaxID=34632 RepID=A0A9D4T659_RHISA|nr:hypothetical protein HPB52_020241 [Rhipicephalus sanguineus]